MNVICSLHLKGLWTASISPIHTLRSINFSIMCLNSKQTSIIWNAPLKCMNPHLQWTCCIVHRWNILNDICALPPPTEEGSRFYLFIFFKTKTQSKTQWKRGCRGQALGKGGGDISTWNMSWICTMNERMREWEWVESFVCHLRTARALNEWSPQ